MSRQHESRPKEVLVDSDNRQVAKKFMSLDFAGCTLHRICFTLGSACPFWSRFQT